MRARPDGLDVKAEWWAGLDDAAHRRVREADTALALALEGEQ